MTAENGRLIAADMAQQIAKRIYLHLLQTTDYDRVTAKRIAVAAANKAGLSLEQDLRPEVE